MKRYIKCSMDWTKEYDPIIKKYMPDYGEGENRAQQIVTDMNRLLYKWWNDGDVFDNHWRNGYLYEDWTNDLSPEGNWMYTYGPSNIKNAMRGVYDCATDKDYEEVLEEMFEIAFDPEMLSKAEQEPTVNSIYTCENGPFSVYSPYDDEDLYEESYDDYDYDADEEW